MNSLLFKALVLTGISLLCLHSLSAVRCVSAVSLRAFHSAIDEGHFTDPRQVSLVRRRACARGQYPSPCRLCGLTRLNLAFNEASGFLLRDSQIVEGLQVQPEFRRGVEVAR